jgi:hypothetical protein
VTKIRAVVDHPFFDRAMNGFGDAFKRESFSEDRFRDDPEATKMLFEEMTRKRKPEPQQPEQPHDPLRDYFQRQHDAQKERKSPEDS